MAPAVTGYAEKLYKCPEWVRSDYLKLFRFTPSSHSRLFEHGMMAIEWIDGERRSWKFCGLKETNEKS